jgi:hypothetical protein
MAIQYDPNVLQKYADQLYSHARWVVVLWALWGFLLGFAASGILAWVLVSRSPGAPPGAWILLLWLVGLALGLAYGRGKAFQFRLEAQRTLCQVQIERNTRPLVPAPAMAASQPPRGITCPKCAKSFPAGTQFCGYCGTPLPAAPPGLGRASE